VCLGGLMCLGLASLLGGGLLLWMLARSGRRAPAPMASPALREACLLSSTGEQIVLALGENTVGRLQENKISLPGDGQVSRHHAMIDWDGRQCMLTDLDSSNGTFVNGNPIRSRVPYLLHSGDRIRFGPDSKFVVRLP
jgi:predicted component of type VI protein secretion system